MMLRATDDLPLNFGFSGKGNSSDNESLKDVLRAGAAGFKCEFSRFVISAFNRPVLPSTFLTFQCTKIGEL